MRNIQLDIWDYKVIRVFKRNKNILNEAKKVWAERCAIEEKDVNLLYINYRLLDVAVSLNLVDADFIFNLKPDSNWKFISGDYFLSEKESDFNLVLFSRLDSLFSLTEVDKIPGYREFREKESKN